MDDVGPVIATAGRVWANPDPLLFKAVHTLALAIAEVMQHKAGENTDNFCVREIWEKQNKFHRRKINFIITFKTHPYTNSNTDLQGDAFAACP